MIEILQTLGICIGSAALVIIALTLFFLYGRIESLFASPFLDDDDTQDDDYQVMDDEDVLVVMPKRGGRKRGKRK